MALLTHPPNIWWQAFADQSLLPVSLFGVAIIVVITIWLLPKRQTARSDGVTIANRFDRENEARKTIAQIVGGIFLLAGLYSSIKTFELQRETEDLQRQGQITDRFTKAIDQLGAIEPRGATDATNRPEINLEVRLGGIYALERIAQDSPRDHWTIMEVLITYVRENSPWPTWKQASDSPYTVTYISEPPVRADIQAALNVIGRRNFDYDPPNRQIDLRRTDLRLTNLSKAHLEGALLTETRLVGANLEGAHLEGATLNRAVLDWVKACGAHLQKAQLSGVYLKQANLANAHLEGANLSGAHLERATFGSASSEGAHLDGAQFLGAKLHGANLLHAIGVDSKALTFTWGDSETTLPAGMKRPPLWNSGDPPKVGGVTWCDSLATQ